MSYDTVEAKLQYLLQALTTEFPNEAQVTRGDWRVMDAGYDQCAVLYAGAYNEKDRSESAFGEFDVTWIAHLALIRKYLDDGTTREAFARSRDAVLEQLMKYPCLGGLPKATMGNITSDTEVEPVNDQDDNGPFFLIQVFSIPVSETLSITPLG